MLIIEHKSFCGMLRFCGTVYGQHDLGAALNQCCMGSGCCARAAADSGGCDASFTAPAAGATAAAISADVSAVGGAAAAAAGAGGAAAGCGATGWVEGPTALM